MAFPDWVRQQAAQLSWGATLAIIANQVSEPLLHAMQGARRSGLQPMLILARGNRADPLVRRLKVPVVDLWEAKDIETWRRLA
jgi:hypothetical protein